MDGAAVQSVDRGSRSRKATKAGRCLRTLAYEITVAEARERERIARGLHDEIGQYLTLARLKLGDLRQRSADAEVLAAIDDLARILGQAANATRSATFDLSNPVLQLGLEEALRSLGNRLARDAGLAVAVNGHLPVLALPEEVVAVVFRVVRELCLNVQKHASARSVCISTWGDATGISICVADDGVGFRGDPARLGFTREGGFGLTSAHAQMQAIGGRLEIASTAGLGTRATVVLDMNR
jgi:signal transduction histidine kinase